MALRVLGISTSPRKHSNSDMLLREALRGAGDAGAGTEYLSLGGVDVGPCVACGACAATGLCVRKDGFHDVLGRMLEADRLVFATPVYFMGVSAQGKHLIDRCQCLWARKYVLRQPLYADGPRDRRGLVIAVGGSRVGRMFDGIRLTMRYWFDALGLVYAANLLVCRTDAAGAVLERPEAMEAARRLGAALADAASPVPEKPTDVLLYGGPDEPARSPAARDGP